MAKGMKFYYDKEADILYLQKKKPTKTQLSREIGNDIVVRLNEKTQKIESVTILNFARRFQDPHAKPLPFEADLELIK